MLELLEQVLVALDKIDGGGGFDLHDSDQYRQRLRDLLAKVKGEPEKGTVDAQRPTPLD
jgi:hypothetical protein